MLERPLVGCHRVGWAACSLTSSAWPSDEDPYRLPSHRVSSMQRAQWLAVGCRTSCSTPWSPPPRRAGGFAQPRVTAAGIGIAIDECLVLKTIHESPALTLQQLGAAVCRSAQYFTSQP